MCRILSSDDNNNNNNNRNVISARRKNKTTPYGAPIERSRATALREKRYGKRDGNVAALFYYTNILYFYYTNGRRRRRRIDRSIGRADTHVVGKSRRLGDNTLSARICGLPQTRARAHAQSTDLPASPPQREHAFTILHDV